MSLVLGPAMEAIRSLIVEELEPRAKLPNEQELVEMTGVSRATVREAIARLEADGAVRKVWGVGTFVADPVPQVGFGFLNLRTGIPGTLETTGGKVTVHRFEAVDLPPAPELFCDFPTDETVSTTRVFALDGLPVVAIRDRMVAEHGGKRLQLGLLRSADGRGPDLFREIGLELHRIEIDIVARDLDASGQAALELPSPEPVVETTGNGFDRVGRRILVSNVTYRTKIMGLHLTVS